ncbi:MAG: tripartite tricarboxylate transporter substrate binding protein [Proteobacteria bacterium]|nr:tripartite tricarboxylate transporter substrate binding protein [Pseudomonadota bacterium]
MLLKCLARMSWALPLLLCAGLAAAQSYPAKPIKLVVPFPPGGSADIIGRTLAQRLAEQMGQPVVVENRAGASAIIGSEFVAKSAPDGYTLLLGNVGSMTIHPFLYPNLPYDPIKDFAPVTLVGAVTSVVVVTAAMPVNSIAELVAWAKANPGKLNFTSSGAGSSTHLTGELLRLRSGISMEHISYKGSAPALLDLVAGNVQLMFENLPSVLPHIKAGRVRALATTAARRSTALPEVPTMIEAGYAGFDMVSWQGVLVPAGTPPEIVARLNAEIVKALQTREVREGYARLGVDVLANTPEQFAAYLRQEQAKWSNIVKDAGIKLAQ